MSFVLDQQDDQESNPQGKDQSQTDISLGGGGSGVATPGSGNVGGSAQGAQAKASKPSASGSWTNLQSYLDANADQGAQVGSQIAGTINQQGKSAQDSVDSAAKEFQSNVDANTVQADSDRVNQTLQQATGLKAGETMSDDDIAAFQKQANASYAGPTDFTASSGYGGAQHAISQAQDSIGETGSEAGRQVLLKNQYQNASTHGYNQGEQNLDQLLLENSQGGRAALEPLKDQWSGLSSILGNATTTENAAAQQAAATDQATAKAAQDALSGTNTKFQGGLNDALAAASQKNSAQYNQALSDLRAGKITHAEAQLLGITAGNPIYNVDATQYLKAGSAPTLYNYATADQYAQAAALAKLAGQGQSTFLPGDYAGQAGTAGPAYGFDASRFTNDINAAKSTYEQQSAALSSQLPELQRQLAIVNNVIATNPTAGSQTGTVGEFGSDTPSQTSYQIQQQQLQAQINQIQGQLATLNQTYTPSRALSWADIENAIGGGG